MTRPLAGPIVAEGRHSPARFLMMKALLLSPPLALVLALAASPCRADGPTLTLAQAVARARAHQPTLAQARANTEAAQGRVEQARAGLLPQVTATAVYQ